MKNDIQSEIKHIPGKEKGKNSAALHIFIRVATRNIIHLIISILLCLSIFSSAIITFCYLASIYPLIRYPISSLAIISGPYLFFVVFFSLYSISNTRIARILYPIGLSISGISLIFCLFIFGKYISLDTMTGSILIIFALINPVSSTFCLTQTERNLFASSSPQIKKWIYLNTSIIIIIAIITIIAIRSERAEFLIQTLAGIVKGD